MLHLLETSTNLTMLTDEVATLTGLDRATVYKILQVGQEFGKNEVKAEVARQAENLIFWVNQK